MSRRIRFVAALLAALGVGGALVTLAAPARARASYRSPYTYDQTFGTALRLLRLDLGLKLLEKDEAGGYLVFEYVSAESGKKVSQGSIEMVRTSSDVGVAVQLPAMPSYHEQVLIDALSKRLERDHGDPPKRAPAAPPSPPADAGADASVN